MTFILSLILLSLALTIVAYQISLYNSITNDRFRFEYFALRDRLNKLVVSGKIDQESKEYKSIMNAINFHISAVERVSIMRMAKLVVDFHATSDESTSVKIYQQKFGSEETRRLMLDFLVVTEKLLRRNNKAEMATFKFLSTRKIKTPSNKVKLQVGKPQAALNHIRQNREQLSNSLSPDFVCA